MQTVPAVLTLVSDTDTIVLRPINPSSSDPILCSNWDLGAPSVRENVSDRPGGDGTIDNSTYTGGRSVTFDLHIFGNAVNSPYAWLERLTAMTHPGIRPRLRVQRASPEAYGQTWEMELRGNPFSISFGRTAAAKLDLTLQFTNPTGYLSGDLQEVTSVMADPTNASGFIFPIAFPLATGTTSASNPLVYAVVAGSAPVTPAIRIYGPVTAPQVTDEAGQTFKLTGLTLAAGNYVDIDMGGATARINGDAAQSALDTVDFSVSTFWTWSPGAHTVRYAATSGSIVVQWRDRRLTI